ncbi:hypothetical protein U2F26_02575 [Micromonospora sp. 4G57]|uniref:Uncharacterized protein n=1 Tax=Micromonospora sicca TaxID=2202420 RepID=A0ABU5JBS1_9ACTN|nr:MULTISPECIES: hypothetical protein [unclassified Micromonospora]MDZ5441619.1 hypothetical protein [Micromonospora sp. 4G57]MDZ5490016.1 hypothetical protein [Micromonospora sp. 4G53]
MSDAGARGKQATATASAVDPVVTVVREILSGIPAGCSWLLPVTSDGQVVDFRVEATSGRGPTFTDGG